MTHPANAYAKPRGEPRLSEVAELSADARSKLASLGITTQRQLASLLNNPTVAPHLYASIPLSDSLVARMLKLPVSPERNVVAAARGVDAWDIDPVPVKPFGALRPREVPRAATRSVSTAATAEPTYELPPSMNLMSLMAGIDDQLDRYTCVAFALTSLHVFSRGNTVNLSEQHVHFEAKQIDGVPNECGTFLKASAQVLRTTGQCPENVWPYQNAASCNAHGVLPQNARQDAERYRIDLREISATDVGGMKSEIAARRPVAFSVPAFRSWAESPAVWDDGIITMPLPGEPESGGHAMVAAGYQDIPDGDDIPPGGGFFIVRNSQGARWGRFSSFGPGYGMIPYAYIDGYGWEAFTIP